MVDTAELPTRSAPSTARDLEKLIEQKNQDWPLHLLMKAEFAKNALKVMDRPDNRDERIQRLHKSDLSAFAAAYAKWRGT